jgi:hypothetical protein
MALPGQASWVAKGEIGLPGPAMAAGTQLFCHHKSGISNNISS